MTRQKIRRAAILQLMGDGNVWAASKLALHTGVHQRTLYRDMAALTKQRKVRGEIAVGYTLRTR